MALSRIRTMEEFAAASGISRPTLSRFFNDPSSVRPTSRARIEQAMVRFGYRPNLLAVNFNRRNPKTLGILVPSLTDPFYAAIVQCLERQALDLGYWTLIQNCLGEPGREAEAMTTLMALNVAGIVAMPIGDVRTGSLYRDAAKAVPLVFVDARAEPDVTFVGTDNAQSVGLMVDYLLRSGSPPSYFDMPDVNQNATERRLVFAAAMGERGLEPRVHAVEPRTWDFERAAFEAASRLFRAERMAGATILCANDRVAFGVLAAASQAGVEVGRMAGLRVAGHDDHPLSRYACPSLTTVAQNSEALASLGLQALMQQVGGDATRPADRRVPATLIMRNSA